MRKILNLLSNLFSYRNNMTDAPGPPASSRQDGTASATPPEGRHETRRRYVVDGKPDDDLLVRVETELFEEGRSFARASGHRDENEAELAALRELADRAAARRTAASYTPNANVADQLLDARYERDLAEEASTDQQVAYARAALRDRTSELASLGDAPTKPSSPAIAAVLGVLAIALTLAPTFHDLVFAGVLARTQAVTASILAGAVMGGVLVWGLLSRSTHPDSSDRFERVLFLGVGLGYGAGLYLMRAASAETPAGHVLAAGFAVVEGIVVLLLELYAAGLRRAWTRYEEMIEPYRAAENQARAAEIHLERCEQQLAGARKRIEAHVGMVREREHLVRANAIVRAAARSAVEAGYRKGLSENCGHVADAAWLPPVAADVRRRSERRRPVNGATNGRARIPHPDGTNASEDGNADLYRLIK